MNQDDGNAVRRESDYVMSGQDGHYTVRWPALHITAMVERVREATDHDVKAEITFSSERPASAGHLKQGRILITSPTAKKSMAKSLEERDSMVDWDQVLEQLCLSVLKDFRAGVPEVLLDGTMDVEASAPWLIEPVVQRDNPTLLYGPGSSGKSWFAQYLAVLADTGMSHGGLTVEPARVMYLDWETSERELGKRLTMIRRGLDIQAPVGIWYKFMTQGLASDIETIRTAILNRGTEFVILDSLGSACMGEPESAEVVLRMFGALRSLGVTALCIDHTNKADVLFGSVYKFNFSRMIFEIKKDQQAGEDNITFGLFHRKANNTKLLRDIGFELAFEPGQVQVNRKDVRDTVLAQHLSVPDRILNAFRQTRDGKMTVRQIVDEVFTDDRPVTEHGIRTALSRLHNSGKLMRRPEDHDVAGMQQYALPMHSWREEPAFIAPYDEHEEDRWTIR